MPVIELTTKINAPIEVCFDLSRSIDLHMASVSDTGEKAIAGKVTGLIEMGESVTWRARHFGIWQTLTSEITVFERPHHFRDSMREGAFARFDHDHYFEIDRAAAVTIMRDTFDYTSPLGILGNIADSLFLKKYMTALLEQRNSHIKSAAEATQSHHGQT